MRQGIVAWHGKPDGPVFRMTEMISLPCNVKILAGFDMLWYYVKKVKRIQR